MTRSPMQSQMELFAAALRIPEVRSSSTRGLVSATRVGISGEIYVIMACRDIPTEGVLEQERSRVSDKGTPSAKKEESRGGRECPRSAGGPSPPPSRLMPKMRMASLKKPSDLMSGKALLSSSEDLRSIKKIHRAYAELLSTSASTSSPVGLVTCRCPQIRRRRSHQEASVHQTWKSRLINPSLIIPLVISRLISTKSL
jgi:hypothetical protein